MISIQIFHRKLPITHRQDEKRLATPVRINSGDGRGVIVYGVLSPDL